MFRLRNSFRNKKSADNYDKKHTMECLEALRDSVWNKKEVEISYDDFSELGHFVWKTHVDTKGINKDFEVQVALQRGNATVFLDGKVIDKFRYVDGTIDERGDWRYHIETDQFMKRYENSLKKVREYILDKYSKKASLMPERFRGIRTYRRF